MGSFSERTFKQYLRTNERNNVWCDSWNCQGIEKTYVQGIHIYLSEMFISEIQKKILNYFKLSTLLATET